MTIKPQDWDHWTIADHIEEAQVWTETDDDDDTEGRQASLVRAQVHVAMAQAMATQEQTRTLELTNELIEQGVIKVMGRLGYSLE